MSQKSPLQIVTEKFGGKDKLVDKLTSLLESDQPKDELKQRLLGAANSKLLRLHLVATTAKEKYGSRDKLVASAAASLGRSKDKDYVAKLGDFSTARLIDVARVAERKAKVAAAKPALAKPAAKPTTAKATAKRAAKTAAKSAIKSATASK